MCSTPSFRIVSSILAVALTAAPSHVALAAGTSATQPSADADEEAEPADADDGDAEPEPEADDDVEPEGDDTEADDEGEGEGEDEAEPVDEGDDDEAEPVDEGDEAEPEPAQPPAPEEYVPNPEDERPEEPRIAGKPRKGKGLMIAGGTVLGAGIVSTIVFGLVSRHCSYDGPLQCRHQNDQEFMIPLGTSVTLLGAMMLAVGVGYHFHYKKWERWTPGQDDKKKNRRTRRGKTALVPALGPGSAGLSWSGRF